MKQSPIATKLLEWYRKAGREHLPWRDPIDPYHVWLSEIMLQQTQVDVVLPYYHRFLETFSSLEMLANAETEAVLGLWSGLGYYARARNLHACAKLLMTQHAGEFPNAPDELEKLPGIGRSTAGAISAIVYNQNAAILDGNARRVLARYFGIEGWPGERKITQALWKLAEQETPADHPRDYTQAIMDLGAMVCQRKPDCSICPLRADCQAYADGKQFTIPSPRPKKTKPHKTVHWLVACHQGEVLLHKRPSKGIWGGLLSLFEFTHLNEIEALLETSEISEKLTTAPVISHSFTHYDLSLYPNILQLEKDQFHSLAEQLAASPYHISDESKLAIPSPVRKLLKQIST